MDYYKSRIIDQNKREYGEDYAALKWISGPEASRATQFRKDILSHLSHYTRIGYKDTKLDCRNLSPGCETCGQGLWSCIFINGKCNCRCFYCPADQNGIGVPMTNTIPFPKVAEYVDYLDKFDFRGVGISGGEPLITLPAVLQFISAIRKRFKEKMYIWLYTNGILLNKDIVAKLKDTGLDEIRFDTGALNYSLEKATLAVGQISRVTVEIPAIPEDYEMLKNKIAEMRDCGIGNLNLHQLRLTPHNFKNIVKRNYTFLHGEKVTVLQSEQAALQLLRYSFEKDIHLPINYCSFVYKNRFQRSAARRRTAVFIKKDYEEITENGYIRYLCLSGDTEALIRQVSVFAEDGVKEGLWFLNNAKDRLYFSPDLWNNVDFGNCALKLGYYEPKILPSISYRNIFLEIPLNKNRKVAIEKIRVSDEITIEGDEIKFFGRLVFDKEEIDSPIVNAKKFSKIRGYEFIRRGLQEYF